jgi:hypothetical protein
MGQLAVSRTRFVRRILGGTPLLTAICGLAAGSAAAPVMERVAVEPGVELEYSVHGQGEPVLLVHAGLFMLNGFGPCSKSRHSPLAIG